MQLYLERDNAVINFQTDGCKVVDGFYPATPASSATRVTEEFTCWFIGSGQDARALVEDIEYYFRLAYQDRNQPSPYRPVYFYFGLENDETAWRSRVYDGRVIFTSRLDNNFRKGRIQFNVVLERDPFWEGAEEQVPLTNGNGTDELNGLNVYNASDDTGTSPNKIQNYVSIDGADVAGDLPAPTRIEMTNKTALVGGSNRLYNMYIAQNVKSYPETFEHILEAEDAAYGATPGSNAAYSGGDYASFSVPGTSLTISGRWVLDSALLAACAGQWFKVTGIFTTAPTAGIKLTAKTTFPSGSPVTMLDAAGEVTLSVLKMQDLGTIQLPPWLSGETNLMPIDLCIYARYAGGASSYVLDFLQLSPLDGYRVLAPRGYGVTTDARLVDDGISGNIFTDGWGSTEKTGHYIGYGEQIKLEPGFDQRLYFLHYGDTGGVAKNRLIEVKVYYRPRRRSI